ncbi:AGAP005926-PA-like protein [Anopheles sinensis]|uniref:AGAP005926-PA-like protein n=1 Tax=Anopheles sinensis TaxID=74873 RepID=A0A084W2K1_ANOSI|nr:AGAP005926-PA-like protein [Anopheles sinensis]
MVLREGDLIGIGTHNNDTDEFYKMSPQVLFYRVCRTPVAENLIVISDDEEDSPEVVENVPVNSTSREEEIEQQTVAPAAALPSATSMIADWEDAGGLVAIPEDQLNKLGDCSDWEQEYDQMIHAARNDDHTAKDQPSDEDDVEPYTQSIFGSIKHEVIELSEQLEEEEERIEELSDEALFDQTDEEHNYNRWKLKLGKGDVKIDAGKVSTATCKVVSPDRDENIDADKESIAAPEAADFEIGIAMDAGRASTAAVKAAAPESPVYYDQGPSTSRSDATSSNRTTESFGGERSQKPAWPKRRASVMDFNIFENPVPVPTKEKGSPAKAMPKRRASISISEFDSIIKKKLKRRCSVSDRCPVKAAAKPIDAWKKEERSNRLKQVAVNEKQYSAPTVEQTKTGSTKPRVKYTENNRGVFLTTPVLPKPVPRSRPTDGEDIVCTQSTTLDAMRSTTIEEEIPDAYAMRPAKLTFKSMERLSNVGRPVPANAAGRVVTMPPRRGSITVIEPPPVPSKVAKKNPTEPQLKPTTSATNNPARSISMAPPPTKPPLKPPPKPPSSSSIKSSAQPTPKGPPSKPSPSLSSSHKPAKTRPTKGILKHSTGRMNKSSKSVKFVESPTTIVVPRYLVDCSGVELPKNLAEILRHQEMAVLSDILRWRVEWLESSAVIDGPFGEHSMLPQIVETFPELKSFQETLHLIMMRELWQDVRARYSSIKTKLPLTELVDVHAQEIPHEMCQITCKAHIKTKSRPEPWGSEIGILFYASQQRQRTCRLFAYVSNRHRGSPGTVSKKPGAPPTVGGDWQWYDVVMYAALAELKDLRSGTRFSFCPITPISPYLRYVKALNMLEYSRLLPNVLSPAEHNGVLVEPGKAFADRPEVRDAIVGRIKPGSLNEVQLDVVLSMLDECSRWGDPSISLIQGPPGTGKSRVIGHLALELIMLEPCRNRVKVLICAQSNTAVDVIAKRLMALKRSIDPDDQYKLLRIGTRDKVDPKCLPIFFDNLVKQSLDAECASMIRSETNNNMRIYSQLQLMMLDKKIPLLEQELASNPDVNRSKLDEYYQRRARLNEQLSQTTGKVAMSSEKRYQEEIKHRKRIIDQASIVCTTLGSCTALATYFADDKYDVCIIDEATQCTELCSLLPLMYGMPKLVLVGDINQLPATVLDRESIKAGFRQSLFSRLQGACGEKRIRTLNVQYRMHPEICRWPNAYFYKRQLKTAPTTLARKPFPLKPYLVVSLSYDQELTQVQHEIYNRNEIDFVVGLLKNVVKNCPKETTIACITPYQRHKAELLEQVHQRKLKQVQVHSIDSVQGKEYDVVIVSLARSNGTGFLNSAERINVALTRARYCLVLCGNFSCLRHQPVWRSVLEDAEKRQLYMHLISDDMQAEILRVSQRLMPKSEPSKSSKSSHSSGV